METAVNIEVLRMVERIIVVLGGVLSIFLGYMLFRIARVRQNSGGNVKFDKFEFAVSKVGPGVFFVGFGAYILVASLNAPVQTTYSRGQNSAGASNIQQPTGQTQAGTGAPIIRERFHMSGSPAVPKNRSSPTIMGTPLTGPPFQ